MPENPKTAPVRPPPIPRSPLAAKGGAADEVKAFVAIRRIRFADRFRRIGALARRRPAMGAVVVLAILGVAGAGLWLGLGDSIELPAVPLLAPKEVTEAAEKAGAHPNDAIARRDLGHTLWSARKRHAAVAAYARALAIDPSVADERTVANLVATFGTRDQHTAEALIWKNKLVGAERGLRPLVHSKRYAVRWSAVHTLDRLDKGTKANWETAYILDLEERPCELKLQAVEKLGAIGTQRAVAALRSAKAEDEKTGGWFKKRCLGDRLDDAEKKILARR